LEGLGGLVGWRVGGIRLVGGIGGLKRLGGWNRRLVGIGGLVGLGEGLGGLVKCVFKEYTHQCAFYEVIE
jgi:hypothetical protein